MRSEECAKKNTVSIQTVEKGWNENAATMRGETPHECGD
jgi:hypothetical protein